MYVYIDPSAPYGDALFFLLTQLSASDSGSHVTYSRVYAPENANMVVKGGHAEWSTGQNGFLTDPSGFILRSEITIETEADTYLDPKVAGHHDAVLKVMRHEVGHSYGLGNASGCNDGETVMNGIGSKNDSANRMPSDWTAADNLRINNRYNPGGPPGRGPLDQDPTTGDCGPSPWPCTPLLLDLGNGGVKMSAPDVLFDFWGTGERGYFSWPTSEFPIGWLFFDRDGDGVVNSGRELFGSATPLSWTVTGPRAPDGFAALGWFDLVQNGGNEDGWIDDQDLVWPELRVWIDANHNGISEPTELQPLSAAGVARVGVRPTEKNRQDRWGNQYHYRAPLILVDEAGRSLQSMVFDIYFGGR